MTNQRTKRNDREKIREQENIIINWASNLSMILGNIKADLNRNKYKSYCDGRRVPLNNQEKQTIVTLIKVE